MLPRFASIVTFFFLEGRTVHALTVIYRLRACDDEWKGKVLVVTARAVEAIGLG